MVTQGVKMLNTIISLTIGILIGWNFHAFFLALDAPKILRTDINISQLSPLNTRDSNISTKSNVSTDFNLTSLSLKKAKVTSDKESTKKIQDPIKTSFYSLLYNGHFSDAIALYHEAGYERVLFYRLTLKKYFKKENSKNQEKTIKEMVEYLKIDPENGEAQLFLSKLYKERKEYKNSINVLNGLIDKNTKIDNDFIDNTLEDTSKLYIEQLKASKNYQELKSFLKTQISLGSKSSFFTLTLAEHYIFMQSFDKATILLKEIEFDEEYGERAKELLDKIENNETNKEEYSYKLPLGKEGSHFTIDVTIDDTPLTLLLDTGATLTLINEEKVPSSLTLINDNITLQTAGGEVDAQLKMAQNIKIGDLELNNFKITSSSFTQENADGLLGMNFFQQFKFKIDQDERLLYLSKK